MSNIRILIVEDDPSYALELEMLIDELGYEVLAIVDNAKAAMAILESNRTDLVLMDIQIKGKVDGIDLAKQIQLENTSVIFITNFKNKDTFDRTKKIKHYGYIVKPFNHFTLEGAIEVALMNNGINDGDLLKTEWDEDLILEDFIFIKKRNRLIKVTIEEIKYLEVDGNYSMIYTKDDKFILKMSLKKVSNILASKSFIRVNKNFVLNINHMEYIDISTNKIYLKDKSFILGRTYKSDVMKKLKLLS